MPVERNAPDTLQTNTWRSVSKNPSVYSTQNRRRALRSLLQSAHQWTRGDTQAVRCEFFHKELCYLPTGYLAMFSFIIITYKIHLSLFLYPFQKVPCICATSSACANRDPIITSDKRIESFRVRVHSRVAYPVVVVSGLMSTSSFSYVLGYM